MADVNCMFNGTTVSFATTPITNLIAVTFDSSSAEIDCGGSADTTELIAAGVPSQTTTVEVVGSANALAKGAKGALAVVWSDTGTAGSMTRAVLADRRKGGGYDGALTTVLTFIPSTGP
jgi:hypothetical protein